MSAHTPGPWKVVRHPRIAHVDSETSVGSGANGMASVAWLTGGRVGQEANARLIAAAPDLLAALEALVLAAPDSDAWSVAATRELRAARDLAEEAIAKARGGA